MLILMNLLHSREGHDRIAYQATQGVYKTYDSKDSLHELNTDYDAILSYGPEYGPREKRLSEFFEYRTESQNPARRNLNEKQDSQKFPNLADSSNLQSIQLKIGEPMCV